MPCVGFNGAGHSSKYMGQVLEESVCREISQVCCRSCYCVGSINKRDKEVVSSMGKARRYILLDLTPHERMRITLPVNIPIEKLVYQQQVIAASLASALPPSCSGTWEHSVVPGRR